MHKVFQQRRNQEQQYPGAERAADEKPIQGDAGTGQQAFQYAGQVIGDGKNYFIFANAAARA